MLLQNVILQEAQQAIIVQFKKALPAAGWLEVTGFVAVVQNSAYCFV
ncbi:hypothetical protein [Spirochaeta dissipatitropha]